MQDIQTLKCLINIKYILQLHKLLNAKQKLLIIDMYWIKKKIKTILHMLILLIIILSSLKATRRQVRQAVL